MNPPYIALFCLSLFTVSAFAEAPQELLVAKKEYEQAKPPGNEAARLNYVNRLAKIVDAFVTDRLTSGSRKSSKDLDPVYAELRKHPAPKDSDSRKLSQFLVGKWQSPRHEYLFRKDGTWSMLPLEEGTTHGTWRIEGNQYSDTAATKPPMTSRYTIIVLNERYFVFMDKDYVFFESRIKE